MSGQQITPEMRAAVPVARAALEGRASAYGPVDAIVVALDSAGLLQSPELAAELEGLRQERGALVARLAELAPYAALHLQDCENSQHRPWFADSPALACPWCEIAHLQAGVGQVFRVERDGVEAGTYATAQAAGDRCETELRAQLPGAECEWIARPDASGALDLITHHGGHTSATGWAVVMVEVQAEYAPAVTS